ncbi:MAG: HDIG domain-containing protein [Ignavibacteriae bacterium]|nr:HDIG domain-containing protein [Ignavibacteriota bacterium]
MFPRGESIESDVAVGSIWIQDDIIATMPFEILKDTETYKKELLQAEEKVFPVFVIDHSIRSIVSDSIGKFNNNLIKSFNEQISSSQPIENYTFLSKESFSQLQKIHKLENSLSVENQTTLNSIFTRINNIVKIIYKENHLSVNYNKVKKDTITFRDGKFENLVPINRFDDKETLKKKVAQLIYRSVGKNLKISVVINEYLQHFIQPTVLYSPELSDAAVKLALEKVSKNVGLVEENERIVAKHNRITPEIKLKIDSYRVAKGEGIGAWAKTLQGIGKFLHVLIIISLLSLYIYLFRKKIFDDNSKIFLITAVILLISFIAYLINQLDVKAPVELLIFVPVVSMLLTIFFDSRVGFYGTVVVALIVGGLRGNNYELVVMNIVAGAFAAYTVRDIKNRNQIFRSFLFILFGYVISILAFGMERFASAESILVQAGFAASNALISSVLTYGLIIFFEKIFKITTELTLLELTDYNTPLLKELAKHAQGTFNHSLTMGNMVESAAEEIGANPIFVRVGALYHDIGKTLNPNAFVENQLDNYNIHDNLAPEESAKIIIQHVTEGIKLAEENNLPQEIIDFISTHHGTLSVSFFYNKAKEKYGEDEVDIKTYQYPGPKPATKETALLMVADACESAVRAMTEPTIEKIENVVTNIISSRQLDGQLEDSPITFADLTKIKDSFCSTLIALHHKRIRYPDQEKLENEKLLESENKNDSEK